MSWTIMQAVEKLQKIAEGFHSNHSTRKDIQEVIAALTSPDILFSEWCVDDIMGQADEKGVKISVEDARDILNDMEHHSDASIGINWDVIDSYLDNPSYNATPMEEEEEED